MANAVATLRPNATTQQGNWSGTPHTALADGNDNGTPTGSSDTTSTANNAATGTQNLIMELGTVAIPAGAQIRSVTPRVRYAAGTAGQQWGYLYPGFGIVQGGVIAGTSPTTDTAVQTVTGGALTVRPSDSGPWTQADIDALQYWVRLPDWSPSASITVYEAYVDVAYNRQPTLTVSAPTSGQVITVTASPTISWAFTDLDGDAQERYRVKIFAGSGTVADPENTLAVWDSGEVFSAASSVVASTLAAGTYRAYVKAADAGSNGRYSTWVTPGSFTIQIDPPGTPTITATPDSLLARIGIVVQGKDNALLLNPADLEVDASGWYVNAGCTLSRSTGAGTFLHGAASLALTASGTPASMSANTADTSSANGTKNSAVGVTPGRIYTALASLKAAATARYVSLTITWYNSTGNALGSSVTGLVHQDATGSWVQPFVSGVAPVFAAYAVLTVTVAAATGTLAASEVHYIDQIALGPTPVRNMLSVGQSGFEVDLSTWVANANATLARSTATALDGAASLSITPTVNGTNASANHANPATPSLGVPVAVGQSYTAVVQFRTAATARSALVNILWYTSGGAFISSAGGAGVTESVTGAWTTVINTAVAPATAAYAIIQPLVVTPSEVHFVDRAQFFVSSVNLLTPNAASIETDTSGYIPGTNAPTLARSTAQFLDGTASISLTATAAGPATMQAGSQPQTPIIAGQSYAAAALSRAGATTRQAGLQINWYTPAGVYISTTTGSLTTNSTTGWTMHTAGGVAPATAGLAQVMLYVPTNPVLSEVHYFDSVSLARTEDVTWLAGERTTAATVVVERSVDGGTTWTTVRGASGVASYWDSPGSQMLTVYDYELARGVAALYRARVLSPVPFATTSPNAQIPAAVSHAATGWWLKDPLSPGLNMAIDVQPGFSFRRKEPQSVHEPVGRNVAVVVTDGVRGVEGSLTIWTKDATRYAKLQALIAAGRSLWLEDVFGRAWYVHSGDATEWSLLRAVPAPGETTPIRHVHSVTLPFVEVGSPAGDTVAVGTPTG